MALNKSLAVAYYMKEDLRQFWEQPGKRFATAFLDDWIKRAEVSGIKMLQQMAKTLATHRSGIVGLLRRDDHERSDGGDEQQDQDDEATGLWVPRQGVLQAEDPGDPRDQVRTSRID